MPEYQLQQSLITTSTLPKDYVQNNWSLRADDLTALQLGVDAVHAFYDEIDGILSNNVVQNGHPWKCYNRADPIPRRPVLEGTMDLASAPSGAPLPHEVAIVLSFHAQPTSGIPMSRLRGRVYLGPITTAMSDTDARLSSANQGAIASAGEDLQIASLAATTWKWVVWSTVDEASTIVIGGWVDNAFDTQRRRGRDTTERVTWP
jgi:hypothetical protein